MSDVRKMIGIGVALVVVGILWVTVWRDWGDLWRVIKGGVGLLLFFMAVVFVLMGLFQQREDLENQRRQEAEKRQEQERKAVV